MRYEDKPWGYEITWANTEQYIGKIIHINEGHMMSLSYHDEKEESLYVQKGRVDVLIQDDVGNMRSHIMNEGSTIHIPAKTPHRIIGICDTDLLEVSSPHPNDIIRLEDNYGRIPVEVSQ